MRLIAQLSTFVIIFGRKITAYFWSTQIKNAFSREKAFLRYIIFRLIVPYVSRMSLVSEW